MTNPRYYSNLPRRPRTRPGDGLPAAGVLADPAVPKSIIGVAFPYTHIGGTPSPADSRINPDPPEVVWRIVLDRDWSDDRIVARSAKQTLEARFVLRDGEFIALGEEAI